MEFLIQDQSQFDLNKSGIYAIICPITQKTYIGQAKNIKKRWQQHKSALKNNRHENSYLQNVFNKYKTLNYFVLENTEKLSSQEELWISKFPKEQLLNLKGSGNVEAMKQEIRDRISLAMKMRWNDPKLRSEMIENRKLSWTEEAKRNLSTAKTGRKLFLTEKQKSIRVERLRNANTKIKREEWPKVMDALSKHTGNEVAKMFGVTPQAISRIKHENIS